MTNARGSLWHRWDLHVHTPASMEHNYAGAEEEQWSSCLRERKGFCYYGLWRGWIKIKLFSGSLAIGR